MAQGLRRYGPALVVLLAAVIYSGTQVWLHEVPTSPSPQHEKADLSHFVLPAPKPSAAECDAYFHYTPKVALPLLGQVQKVSGGVLTVKSADGVHEVALVSGTRIVGSGKRKPGAEAAADLADFDKLMKGCNDGTRVYMAPDGRDVVSLTPAGLKQGKGIQVFMDETDISKKQAAGVMLLWPLEP